MRALMRGLLRRLEFWRYRLTVLREQPHPWAWVRQYIVQRLRTSLRPTLGDPAWAPVSLGLHRATVRLGVALVVCFALLVGPLLTPLNLLPAERIERVVHVRGFRPLTIVQPAHLLLFRLRSPPSPTTGDPIAPLQWSPTSPNVTGTSWSVSTRAQLITAIASAVRGDEIVLTASFDTTTEINCTQKSGSVSGADGWILVRTDRSSLLPAAGTRIRPSDAATKLRKIRTTSSECAIRVTGDGWWFRGLEVECDATGEVNFGEVKFGPDNPSSLSAAPDYVVWEHGYIHSENTTDCQRGIQMNCRHNAVIDSYVYARSVQMETQAICGWACPGPTELRNTTFIGSCENFMWGGADSLSAALSNADLHVDRSYFFAPGSWSTQAHQRKNLFEIKTVNRALVENSLMEGNWSQAQSGLAVLLTPSNNSGNQFWGTVKDVRFSNCKLLKSVGCFNFTRRATNSFALDEVLTRVLVENFLLEDLNGTYTNAGGGDARTIQLAYDIIDVKFRRLTADTPLQITSWYVDDQGYTLKPLRHELSDCIFTTRLSGGHSFIRNGGGNPFTTGSLQTPTLGHNVHIPNLTSVGEVIPAGSEWAASLAAAEATGAGCNRTTVATAVSGVNVYEAIGTD